jgi:hypothetical protein
MTIGASSKAATAIAQKASPEAERGARRDTSEVTVLTEVTGEGNGSLEETGFRRVQFYQE